MHRFTIAVFASIVLVVAIVVAIAHGSPNQIRTGKAASASVQVTDTRICLSAHGFAPESYSGFIIRYVSLDQTVKRSAYANVIDGKIDLANPNLYLYEVDAEGNVRNCFSRHLITGGSSGMVLVSAGSTGGDLVTAEANL